jgi:hypothetical protein
MARFVIALSTPKFPLGEIVITANVQATLDAENVQQGLLRHARGDWGDLCPEDAHSNANALKHGGRLMSVYGEGETRFWIITEWDRSVTTVLLPMDY